MIFDESRPNRRLVWRQDEVAAASGSGRAKVVACGARDDVIGLPQRDLAASGISTLLPHPTRLGSIPVPPASPLIGDEMPARGTESRKQGQCVFGVYGVIPSRLRFLAIVPSVFWLCGDMKGLEGMRAGTTMTKMGRPF